MAFIARQLRAFANRLDGGARKRAPDLIFPRPLYGAYGEPPPSYVSATPELYALSEAVNTAVNTISASVASAPYALYSVAGKGEPEQVYDHPLLNLLTRPNPYFTRTLLMEFLAADLLLSGNAYWFLAGPALGAPSEIWRMNPTRVRVVRTSREYVSGYVYTVDGADVPLSTGEVIHFRLKNPFDEFYGMGILQAAALAAATQREMATWNRNTFKGGRAIPAGIVSMPGDVSDPDFERLQTEWRSNYGGTENKTAFIRGTDVSFHKVGLDQKEVDYLEGIRWQREDIFTVFRCWHLIGDLEEGALKVKERLYLEGTVWPLLLQVAETLTADLLPFWARRGGLTLAFEDIRPRERALELQEETFRRDAMTVNEARALKGDKPLPGGDDVMWPHYMAGAKLEFEREAEPEPPPVPPGLFGLPRAANEDAQTTEDEAEEASARGEDVGDEIGGEAEERAEEGRPARKGVPATPLKVAAYTPIQASVPWTPDPTQGFGFDVPFAGNAALLALRAYLQNIKPYEGIAWRGPDWHLSLAYTNTGNPWTAQNVLQNTYFVDPTSEAVFTALEVWDNPMGRVLVLAAEPSVNLTRLQASAVLALIFNNLPIGEYSLPDAWRPHVTLATNWPADMPAPALPGGPLTLAIDTVRMVAGQPPRSIYQWTLQKLEMNVVLAKTAQAELRQWQKWAIARADELWSGA